MIKKVPRTLFLGCVLTSLVIGPVFDFARGGAPSTLQSVNRGIFATLATDCTIYAAANGNDTSDGTKHADGTIYPKTLYGAGASTVPGSVVCLLGGRYELPYAFVPPYGGSSSSWITYKNYGDGDVLLVWTLRLRHRRSQYHRPQRLHPGRRRSECRPVLQLDQRDFVQYKPVLQLL